LKLRHPNRASFPVGSEKQLLKPVLFLKNFYLFA